MTVTQVLGGLGSWTFQLKDDTPDEVLSKLGFFGHVAIVRGPVDVAATSPYLLAAARYVGVLLELSKDRRTLSGDGMVHWLGDEDGKPILKTAVTLNGASLATAVNAVLPPAVHAGTIHAAAGTFSKTFQYVSRREALDAICDAFNVEYRVNGDGTIDVGTQAQLYRTSPTTIVAAKNAGADLDLTSLGASFDVDESARDYTDEVVVLGQRYEGETSTTFVEATATAPSVPYLDLFGNPVKKTRAISKSDADETNALAVANLNLNRFNRTAVALKVTADDYSVGATGGGTPTFNVGDNAYVYDPANGIFDPARTIDFRGERIHPDVVRITGATWPVSEAHTVAFRTQAGEWVDLTPHVVWEIGGGEITVGDLPKSLTGGTSNPILDRIDTLPDTTTPSAPTDLDLSTFAVVEPTGQLSAVIRAEWTAPALNTDGSVVNDLSHYFVQWRMVAPGMVFEATAVDGTSIDLQGLVPDWDYEVRVAAVDRANHVSAYTAALGIHTAQDDIAPPAPSDPTVSNYLGQLRIYWDGKTNTGGEQPPDFNRVDVHVSATSGFTPSATTLVASLSTAGYAYATALYGATRYVKLVAYDTADNPSAPSGQVAGSTSQVVSADIFNSAVGSAKLADLAVITAKIDDLAVNDAKIGSMSVGKLTAGVMTADVTISGRFATALTGARVELNALGVQKWNASNQLMVSITGTTNLITGQIQSALSGERFIMNPGGANPSRIDLYPTSGSQFASIEAETVDSQAAVTISANNAQSAGVSGVLLVRRGFAHLFYGRKDFSEVWTEIYTDVGTARMTAPIVDVIVDGARNAPGGDRFSMVVKNASGKVASTQLNYWNSDDATNHPLLTAVNRDSGILFTQGAVNIVGNAFGNRRDLNVQSVFYTGALVPGSSIEIKDEVTPLETVLDVRGAFRKAKARRYRMPHLAEAGRPADDRTGPVEPRQAPRQVGLIAEELPAAVQRQAAGPVPGESVLGYDLGGVVALNWQATGDLFNDVDALRAEIAALRAALPPTTPPRGRT
ncbi:hypothetical protein [Blastococcus sp. SYSU D00813]